MSDVYFDPITPEIVDTPPNNRNMIIITVVIVVVLCCCICLCAFFLLPALLGPSIGDVFSEIQYDLMLTPMP